MRFVNVLRTTSCTKISVSSKIEQKSIPDISDQEARMARLELVHCSAMHCYETAGGQASKTAHPQPSVRDFGR